MASLYELAVQGSFIGYLVMLILDYHFHFFGIDWSFASFASLYDTDPDDE